MRERYLSIVDRHGGGSPVSPGTRSRSASSSSGEGDPLRAVPDLLCPLSQAAEYDDTFMPFLSVTVPAEGGRYQPDMKPGAAGGAAVSVANQYTSLSGGYRPGEYPDVPSLFSQGRSDK